MRRTTRLASRLALGLSLLATATAGDVRPAFADSVCTVVKLTLGQTAALEREAFNAKLVLTNNQADAPLTNLSVTISIKDANGNPVNTLFFNKVTDLGGVTAVDGSGTMQPASQATINWLIIPSPGAGGTSGSGSNYNVSAQISYVAGGVPSTNSTQDAGITVVPQPLLSIEYALPFEVFGVDPFTLTGTTEPFPLGLRVTNVGAGTASNFQVTSAQPTITDNKQGLPINFQILGTFVGSNPLSVNTLTIPFGNIAPGATSLAAWDMTSSYSGRFIDFTVGFTHAAELGGALTSLIQGVSTYTLIKDVLDDQPGHDAQFDLLVNTSTARSAMEAGYQNGLEPQPDSIMESDRPGLIPVQNVPAHLTGALSGSNAVVSFAYDQAVPTGTWVHSSMPFPQGSSVSLVSVARSDGKVINPHNAWIAKHIDKLTNTRTYFLHVLDYSPAQPVSYAMAFNAASLVTPPDPITNLSAAVAPGAVALNWTATGDAGSAGAIVGGQYAIFASTDLSATPSVSSAAVVFSTATPALAAQGYALNGLLGNTTYQAAVFLANSGGQFSAASNRALALTLANPPTAVQIAATTPASFALAWSTTANGPGTLYQVAASSTPGVILTSTPGAYAADQSSASFSGLGPNTVYYVTASEKNSALAVTPAVIIATVTTLAAPPAPAAQTVVAASSSTLTLQWSYGSDPNDTEFYAELSTSAGQTPPEFSSGWTRAASFAFAGLSAQTTYYARVKARSRAGIETAYTDLGSVRTPAFSINPVTGASGASFALSGAAFGPYAGANTRVRFGAGGPTAMIASWTNARIAGTVPALPSGSYAVLVERQSSAAVTTINGPMFIVAGPAVGGGPSISLTPADGDLVALSTPTLTAAYADGTSALSTATFAWSLDGVVITTRSSVGANSASFVPTADLSQGTHTVSAVIADAASSSAAATATFLIDTIAPVTTLSVDGLAVSATALTVISTDSLSLAAADGGSGVSDVQYILDADPMACDFSAYDGGAPAGTCANPFFDVPFSVAPGTHTLSFYASDDAGNVEFVNEVALTARAPLYAAASADGVATLVSPLVGETLTAVSASSQAAAAAAAQHLTPATSSYDLSPSGVVFNPAAALQFRFNPNALSTTTLAIYTFNGVSWDSAAITGQQLTSLSSSAVLLSGTLAHASLYGVFSAPLDVLPPRTSLALGAPVFVASQTYVSSATPLGFSVVDDKLVAGDGQGVGAASTYYAVDGASFTAYSGTFTLVAQGTHTISFYSADAAGNTEVARSSAIALDAATPATRLAYAGGRQFAVPGAVYASSDTGFAFSAVDPVSSGVASGVAFTRYRDGADAFQVYASSFALAEGSHALGFQSQDNVGNLELLEGATVFVDATPPVSTVAVGSPSFTASDGTLYIGTTTPVTFIAADPALTSSTIAGSGVGRIEVAVDTTAFTAYNSTLIFAEGRHTVQYRAVDNVGNVEATRTLLVQADATPPTLQLQVLNSSFTDAAGNLDVSTTSALGFLSIDPAVSSVASGVRLTQYQVNSGSFTIYSGTFTLAAPDGPRLLAFTASDNIGNGSLLKSATVYLDATAPVTTLTVGAPQFVSSGAVYVSTLTPVSLAPQDPPVNGVASGVASTRWQDGGGAFSTFVSSFALAEGSHTLTFQSQDNVGNLEVVKSTAILVDATPPVSAAAIGAPLYTAADGTQYVTPATPVTLTAADPVVNGAASGLDHIEVAVDSAPFMTYVSTLTFAEGRHTILFRAVDRVGNVEAAHTLRLQSDDTAPATALQASGSYFAAAGRNFAPLSFNYALPAQDPVVNGVASGVATTLFRVDASSFTHYASTFSLTEGVRRVDFQSADNVGNQELLKSATVYVDATAPLTALTIGQPQYPAPGGLLFVGPTAPFALTAQDPVVQGVASGVSALSVRVDSAPFAIYSATFTLTPGDGLRTVGWFSSDNVGNAETPKLSTVALDATPPLTSLLVTGGRQFAGPDAETFYASADTRLVLVSTDPTVNGVASGVAFTRWQDDNGTFTTYISSLALAEGAHKLGYQSQDNVANLEVLRSTTALIDATPPATTVAIGSPTFTAADGTIYVATATPVAFAAADPNLPTGQAGSGLNRIETSLDGAPFTPYTVALTLAEGRHVILYRAVDNVGNVEPTHSISIQSDATPPASLLVIGAPQFQLPGVLLVSSRTPFGVAAVDPMTNNVASGVKDTSYRVSDVAPSTAAFAIYTATFAMAGADVNKVVEFHSRDNVLNTEITKSSTVLLDSTPPEIALLSPAACDSGICRVLKGKFPVLGAAHDLHFGNYRLEFAAGQNAVSSFTFVSSGTAAVNAGPLGVWDATALTGWFTLRLTATDLVANSASVAINVFVGDPGELLTLGNHEVFNMPEGVAAGSDGKIYVADRDNDRVAVFSSTGALLASFGSRGHDDDHLSSTGTLTLDEPSGVAVDAAGNIYVADTDHDRVLKLSATGQILLSLGGLEREQEDRHDDKSEDHGHRQPGRLHHPAGVAVDASQNIYVADTDNRRVQVFNSTGGFSFQFDLPPVPARTGRDDDDHDEHEDPSVAALGKPFGIALDAAGDIYVADSKGGRALKFGATGQLLLTIPIAGDKPGTWGQPFGVAVSTSGDCLLVSDRKDSRILKFDFQGSQNLVFGAKGKVHDDGTPSPRSNIVFNKPMGLALDAQGALLVADRNNDRVRKFALPTGQPPLVVPTPKPGDEDAARDVVDKEYGGKVERKDLAGVDIPAGAVARDMKVTVSTPSEGVVDESSRQHAADAAQLKTASPPVEYGPEGTKFAAPVTLTLPYSPDLMALEGVDEADLTVRYWNRDKAQWENLDSTVDPKTRTVKAKTTHFSLYQVFSGTASAAGLRPLAVGDPTFVFHDAYAFPNPVRGTNVVTIRMQTGLADSVEVRAYDVSGRKVYSSSNFSLNPGLDDGNGKGIQYTYDNVWDISGVGSGVYQYVITAKKSGKSDIHKAGRVGVIK